jgi:hypothetical protein
MQCVKDISSAPDKLEAAEDFVTDFDYPEDTCDPHGMSGCGAWRIPKTSNGKLWQHTELNSWELKLAIIKHQTFYGLCTSVALFGC